MVASIDERGQAVETSLMSKQLREQTHAKARHDGRGVVSHNQDDVIRHHKRAPVTLRDAAHVLREPYQEKYLSEAGGELTTRDTRWLKVSYKRHAVAEGKLGVQQI